MNYCNRKTLYLGFKSKSIFFCCLTIRIKGGGHTLTSGNFRAATNRREQNIFASESDSDAACQSQQRQSDLRGKATDRKRADLKKSLKKSNVKNLEEKVDLYARKYGLRGPTMNPLPMLLEKAAAVQQTHANISLYS